ncbi:hemerythrin domain-containing protein [Neorhizobium alkalisoli]|uniref:hemerythrin domain-containing protein n=1 Tax=Neorhizobium alkalisoli TaxID=528178 RepID=UPI000CF97206|nr:hemerythrin domain-containing protein [Neorhizobium alkalisoli]
MTIKAKLSAQNLAVLERNHEALLELCLALEEIASSLPGEIDRVTCLAASEDIGALIEMTHVLEEEVLFPDFSSNAGSNFAQRMIERLKAEHRCDLLAGREVSKTLKELATSSGASISSAHHLLQGFQEALRRHVHSEKLIIEALLVAEAEGREVLC